MNQILSIDNNPQKDKGKKNKKKDKIKNNQPIEIQTILKFFTISILVFGICIIGTGSYSMYKESTKQVAKTKPTIYVEETSEDQILLKVTHDKELSTISYNWNDEDANYVSCNGKKTAQTTIEIPSGTNTLKVYASDINGQEIEYQKAYTKESDININIEAEGNNLKVTANGINQLQYMTYRWDEEDETRIDSESNQIEETIEIPRGLHKLTVIVVDINNHTETKEQDVNGVTKPKLDVSTDGENFIIHASDEQGLSKVEFIINEVDKYRLDLEAELSPEDRKEFEYAYPLNDGENKLEVTIYNESGVSETFRAKFNKE
ncbi:MAG: hypothetical protein HFJ34_02765 [Clostridia bacterium]|nr:hypothetical protein [Clostridia bacterium]